MSALLHDAAILKHYDLVRFDDSRQSVPGGLINLEMYFLK